MSRPSQSSRVDIKANNVRYKNLQKNYLSNLCTLAGEGGGLGFPRNIVKLTNLKRVIKRMHSHAFPLVALQPPQIPLSR
jgi:hypothetical protein